VKEHPIAFANRTKKRKDENSAHDLLTSDFKWPKELQEIPGKRNHAQLTFLSNLQPMTARFSCNRVIPVVAPQLNVSASELDGFSEEILSQDSGLR